MSKLDVETERLLDKIERERKVFVPSPTKGLSVAQRLAKYNEILKNNSLTTLEVLPPYTVTLDPVHPRLSQSIYLQCYGHILLEFQDTSGMIFCKNTGKAEPTSFIALHLSTIEGATYALELQVSCSGDSIYKTAVHNSNMVILDLQIGNLTNFLVSAGMEPIILGFKATSQSKDYILIPDSSDNWLIFYYCKLTALT